MFAAGCTIPEFIFHRFEAAAGFPVKKASEAAFEKR
jgi:hypothetical protein